jgi:DNA helicase-2/ATP-dependent DNA helicase PcrA
VDTAAEASELGRSAPKVAAFAELMRELAPLGDGPAQAAVETVVSRTGIRAALLAEADVNRDPLDNVQELISAAAVFQAERPDARLLDFLEHTSLISDVDAVDAEAGSVTLMTLHAAKGLEFPVAYMIALEHGLLPIDREGDGAEEEEERRLCFVGMTRAKEELTLTRADYRMLHGRTERQLESIFLSELPDEEIEWIDLHEDEDEFSPCKPQARLPDDIELWEVGTLVRHPTLGLARVQWLTPAIGDQTRIGLRFRNGEEKTFILEYAKLQRVDFHEVE